MKIRHGFVSNSSSSSYILEIKEKIKNVCPTCGRYDPHFTNMLEQQSHLYYDDTCLNDQTPQEIIAELKRDRGYFEADEGEYKNFTKLIAKIKRAKGDVISCNISNHDEIAKTVLQNMINSGNIKILRGDED